MTRARNETKWASPAVVEKASEQWSDTVIRCRTKGHDWEQQNATHVVRYRYWRVQYRCTHGCLCELYEEWNERGVVLVSWVDYPKNSDGTEHYLLKGMGRLTNESKGVLRIKRVNRDGFHEQITADDDEYRPRSSITEAAVGRKRSARDTLRLAKEA